MRAPARALTAPAAAHGPGIPYWDFGGSTVVADDYVRLTPDRQSRQGMLWNMVVRRAHQLCATGQRRRPRHPLRRARL